MITQWTTAHGRLLRSAGLWLVAVGLGLAMVLVFAPAQALADSSRLKRA